MLVIACINISANLALVVLMCKTEKRTLQNRRPEYDLLQNSPGSKRRLLVDDAYSPAAVNGPFIKVKFKRKLVNQTYFTLRITTHSEKFGSYTVNKQYKDFEEL